MEDHLSVGKEMADFSQALPNDFMDIVVRDLKGLGPIAIKQVLAAIETVRGNEKEGEAIPDCITVNITVTKEWAGTEELAGTHIYLTRTHKVK